MNIVLGFGIAGIGAYYADNNLTVYEKSNIAGGLCSGFYVGDFYFDNAVHLSFTNNSIVRRVFDETPYLVHKPESCSFYKDRWLRHPAQNNLFSCDINDKISAIKGFIERDIKTESDNFEEWTKSQYGDWLYDNLFKPYNEKYWCTKLDKLGTSWIGNRIYQPTIDELLYGCLTSDTPNTYYAKEMRYPKEGKYISFVKNIIATAEENDRIKYKYEVKNIDVKNHVIYFSNGIQESYDILLSSIPMDELVNIIDHIPQEIRDSGKKLEHTGMLLVSFGFKRVIDFNKMWCYFYDEDVMASRAYLPHIKSQANAPSQCSSIQFEIYFNAKESVPNKEDCIANCIYALKKTGIANNSDIIVTDCRVIPYANVIFKKDTDEITTKIRSWLKDNGVIPIGRFGEWKYYWSDQSFMSGYDAVIEQTKQCYRIKDINEHT